LTRQEQKICRTGDEHAHNYMTDTKHSLPSIVDNIKPKVISKLVRTWTSISVKIFVSNHYLDSWVSCVDVIQLYVTGLVLD
jgi:hypothetical protein